MNIHTIESQILTAHRENDREQIKKIYTDLSAQRNKMDRWFNKYLDLFSEKIGSAPKTDPVKKLYETKCAEYSKIAHLVRIAEQYMVKN